MTARPPRWALMLLLVVVAGGAAMIGVPAIRRPTLRALGWALVTDAPLETVDIILVGVDADGAGVLEAADLVHGGIAARVGVFGLAPDAVEREFIRRDVPYEDAAARSVRQLHSLGVRAAERFPRAVVGTEDEGRVLPEWCDEHHLRSVVVVSTADHSRRLGRVLRRAMAGRQTKVAVRRARYSDFDPDSWWQSRDGIRTEIEELEKLLLDVVRHPVS